MAAWPADLPQYPRRDSFRESRIPHKVTFTPDVGPSMSRGKFTTDIHVFALQYDFTDDDRASLDYFHDTTCLQGTVAFDWTHPETGDTWSVKFISPPGYSSNEHEFVADVAIRGALK